MPTFNVENEIGLILGVCLMTLQYLIHTFTDAADAMLYTSAEVTNGISLSQYL